MKKNFILALLTVMSLNCHALYVEIHLSSSNTLSERIASSKKYLIDSLKITGYLGAEDVRFIRNMCGATNSIDNDKYPDFSSYSTTDKKLNYLDLSEAHIVTSDNWYLVTKLNGGLASNYHYLKKDVIGTKMFIYCRTLKKLILPNYITQIESLAFACCDNLTEIIIPDCSLSVSSDALDYCKNLSTISIPDECKGSFNFVQCTSLKSVYLGKSFSGADFYNCTALENIYVSNENQYFISVDGILHSKDQKEFIAYPMGRRDESYYVINGIEKIANNAFRYNQHLKKLHLPSSIKAIGAYSFYHVTFSQIWLSSIIPPAIEDNSFIYYSNDEDFRTECTLYIPKGTYSSYWIAGGWGDFHSIVEFGETDDAKQCATPQISLENGVLHFTSKTKDAKFYYSISNDDIATNLLSDGCVNLTASYKVSVYATANDYTRSQTAYAILKWIEGEVNITDDIEFLQTPRRAILASSYDGIISIDGLIDGESVSAYSLNGNLLEEQRAINNKVNLKVCVNNEYIICKIGNNSLKIFVE